MTVGLPGVGIGGIFYLVSALLMPVRELGRAARGAPGERRWGLVAQQSTIAVGILVALWATGWAIGRVIMRAPALSASIAGHGTHTMNVVRVSALALSLGTLALVLLITQIARYVVLRRGGIPRQRLTPMRPATGVLHDVVGYEMAQRDTGTGGRRHSGQFRRR
jgi:hypothetical protein